MRPEGSETYRVNNLISGPSLKTLCPRGKRKGGERGSEKDAFGFDGSSGYGDHGGRDNESGVRRRKSSRESLRPK